MKKPPEKFTNLILGFLAIQVVLCLAGSLIVLGSPVLSVVALVVGTFILFATTIFEKSCSQAVLTSVRYARLRLRSFLGSGLLIGALLFLFGLMYGLTRS